MKTSRYFFTLLLLIAFVTTGFAANSEANFSKIEKTWTLRADGSQEFRCVSEMTLYTYNAMHNIYGESFIIYNPLQQKLTINESYTKQKDGNIVKTPANAFVESLPYEAVDAPGFNHLKEMVVVHTGLEIGATIYLDYTITTKAGYLPALDINEMLQEASPVSSYSVTINVPEGKKLNYQLAGSAVKCTESSSNGMHSYKWNLTNVPASSREGFLAINADDVPHLTATTFGSFKEALAEMNKRFAASKSYGSRTNAEYLTEKATSDKDKIQKIQNYVVNDLATVRVTLPHAGFALRDAEEVQRTAYGTIAEKTQMLSTMLDAVGIKNDVVVNVPANLNPEAEGLSSIRHFLVRVNIDGQTQFLAPVVTDEPTFIHRGALDKYFTLAGEEIQMPTTPVVVNEQMEVKADASKAENGYLVVDLPAAGKGIDSWGMSHLNSERTQTFELPTELDETVTYTIDLPSGMELITPATTREITKPFGSISRSVTKEGNTVTVVRKIKLNQMQFTPAEYAALRTIVSEWFTTANNTILLSVK